MNTVERNIRLRRISFLVGIVLAISLWSGLPHLKSLSHPADARKLEASYIEENDLILAQTALGKLAVKDAMSREGYERSQFSQGWADIRGCDMRNRILQRDLVNIQLDEDNCRVLSGVLEPDPFTGQRIEFKQGRDTSNAIHIEHLVAVSDAWSKGAQHLTSEERFAFYNDPLNLVAVDGPTNIEKGDSDAAAWLPHEEYRCRYVARQIAVKLRYELWVTSAEHSAMNRVLQTCPLQVLPAQTRGEEI